MNPAGIVISLNGTGTLTDSVGTPVLSFTPPALATVLVDGEVPTVTVVTPPAPGNYNATAGTNTLDITLTLSEASIVTGSPSIPLTIGGAVRQATFNPAASTANTAVFRYTITSATDVFANGSFTIGQVSLNGGTVRDAADNDANLAFTAPTVSGVNINRTAPTVTVSAGTGTTSKIGQVIELTATFAQAVDVTGTGANAATIGITVGGTPQVARYVSGTGTTTIKFQYVVQAGQAPPTFIVFVSGGDLGDDYLRFLEGRLRGAAEFTGTPVQVFTRAKERRR